MSHGLLADVSLSDQKRDTLLVAKLAVTTSLVVPWLSSRIASGRRRGSWAGLPYAVAARREAAKKARSRRQVRRLAAGSRRQTTGVTVVDDWRRGESTGCHRGSSRWRDHIETQPRRFQFYHGFFLFSSFFVCTSNLRAHWTELNENRGPKPPFSTSQLNGNNNGLYLRNETWCGQSVKCIDNYSGPLHRPEMSWTLVHKRLQTRPPFLLTLCKFCFLRHCQALQTYV